VNERAGRDASPVRVFDHGDLGLFGRLIGGGRPRYEGDDPVAFQPLFLYKSAGEGTGAPGIWLDEIRTDIFGEREDALVPILEEGRHRRSSNVGRRRGMRGRLTNKGMTYG